MSKLIILTSWSKAPCLQPELVSRFLFTTLLTAAATYVRSPFRKQPESVRVCEQLDLLLVWSTTHLKINFYAARSSKHDRAFIPCFSTKHGSSCKWTNSIFIFLLHLMRAWNSFKAAVKVNCRNQMHSDSRKNSAKPLPNKPGSGF